MSKLLTERAGRRKDPGKLTRLRSRIEDVRHGHQRSALLNVSPPHSVHIASTAPLHHQGTALVLRRNVSAPLNSAGTNDRFNIYFPLPIDHRLFSLVAQNVVRGFLTNMALIQGGPIFACDMVIEDYCQITPLPRPVEIPPSLHPTLLQQTVSHPPWIDLYPIAAARDTLIKSLGIFDESDLCEDGVGLMFKDKNRIKECGRSSDRDFQSQDAPNNKGLIVWGEPWDAGSWEVTEGFLVNWGWMFRDCYEEVLRATNHWRSMRAEKPLVWRGGV
jgi:hypothetical protein